MTLSDTSPDAPTSAASARLPADPVLIVSGDFVRTGGMDISNYYLADFLARQSIPVHIVSHNVDPNLLSYPTVTWHRVARPLASSLLGERFLRRAGWRTFGHKELAKAISVVNGGNCPLPAANWVHYVHAVASPQTQAGLLRKLKARIAHRTFLADEVTALNRARVIIANSKRTKDDLIRHYGISPDRIQVIYYGSDPVVFHPESRGAKRSLRNRLGLPPDKFLVSFVGALGDRRKGFDTLFDAWCQMPPSFVKSSCLIVLGRGGELAAWKKRASEPAEGRSIQFLGFRRDVPEVLRACDSFVAPSRYESFGLAVHEALCCGLPAIVSRSAGVAELYPEALNELLLNDAESASELASILQSVRDRFDYFRSATENFGETLGRYTWDHMAQAIHTTLTASLN